ncbi:MAG: CvpA family protein [Alphaproteobacteria bacterium]|nr:MAG: CvpA family protein [Alphaproteobacteria bacterium]
MSLAVTDIIIIVVVLASGLMALLRGFVREVLTIIAWVGAAIIAIYLFPYLRPMARGILNPPLLADVASFAVLYLMVLIPAFILTSRVGRRFGRDNPGVLDRTGGFIFGVARGLFIVGLAFWVHAMVLDPGAVPSWAENSRLRPVILAVASIFPQDMGAIATSSQTRKSTAPDPPADQATAADEKDEGYKPEDRRSIDQLITTTTDE